MSAPVTIRCFAGPRDPPLKPLSLRGGLKARNVVDDDAQPPTDIAAWCRDVRTMMLHDLLDGRALRRVAPLAPKRPITLPHGVDRILPDWHPQQPD